MKPPAKLLRWIREALVENLVWKALSLIIAVVIWALVGSEPDLATFATVRLEYKNLPDDLYRKLKARAKRERRSVSQEVKVLLTEALGSTARLSILQLQGLGKELWRDDDAEAHVADERTTWR